jgi:hypothetical protein
MIKKHAFFMEPVMLKARLRHCMGLNPYLCVSL